MSQDIEKHILDVSTGRIRLGLTPSQLDQYIQDQYRKLRDIRAAS